MLAHLVLEGLVGTDGQKVLDHFKPSILAGTIERRRVALIL